MVATTAGTWFASDLAVDALRKSTGQNLEEVAVQLRDKIQLDLHERYSDLMVAAALASEQMENEQDSDVTGMLNALEKNFLAYAWLGLVSPDGTVLASSGDMLKGMNVGHRPWFQEASTKPYLGDAHEALLLAEKLENESERPLRFVDVAVPLTSSDGGFLGVLGAHLYLDWVAGIGESLLAPMQERLQSELIVADKEGKVLIGPEGSLGSTLNQSLIEAAQSDKPGYMTTRTGLKTQANGEDYLVGYSRMQDHDEYASFNWLVLVSKPAEEAFLPARELRNTLVISGALVAIVLILFASTMARRTTRPLLQMAHEADNLDPDNPSTLIQLRDDYQEVKVLSSVLRDLIQRLAEKTRQMNELNTNLEHRVAERTTELEEANRRLEETVRTDSLTGLNNRRFFFELGHSAVKKSVRSGKPLSVIMFDADLFKKVNDTYGHAVGDKALIQLSEVAQNTVREIDLLARIGGEEFAILLEDSDEDAAAEVAERLRKTVNDSPVALERGEVMLSISAGVASFVPDRDNKLDDLLVYADKALYAAKSSGRNRVCRHSETSSKDRSSEGDLMG
ncbi:diguanylate cyclase [Marinobacter sp. CHS3-4]|uniref:sensor domain-containing diguanylate cyclase n=1 Tax=Marinobacter sp. CHS3-4 TaxID=3045174 RepID=UPI0024B4B6A8|nr:diguanylate cyclase [Marinobacter sp. CHS3-4]MDI9243827.1 diguanylate cyclase [Marinobacter sp. CHS3-4]